MKKTLLTALMLISAVGFSVVPSSVSAQAPSTLDVCLENCDLIFHLRKAYCYSEMSEKPVSQVAPTYDGQPLEWYEEECIEQSLEEHGACMRRCHGITSK